MTNASVLSRAINWVATQAQAMGCDLRVITSYRHRHVAGGASTDAAATRMFEGAT